jgi:hypothetical protein
MTRVSEKKDGDELFNRIGWDQRKADCLISNVLSMLFFFSLVCHIRLTGWTSHNYSSFDLGKFHSSIDNDKYTTTSLSRRRHVDKIWQFFCFYMIMENSWTSGENPHVYSSPYEEYCNSSSIARKNKNRETKRKREGTKRRKKKKKKKTSTKQRNESTATKKKKSRETRDTT